MYLLEEICAELGKKVVNEKEVIYLVTKGVNHWMRPQDHSFF